MASGDTKTNQYLDVAANGTRADLPTDTCCETRTQTLVREVAERIIGVEEEVERLENNPDVVDIVATYQDLQDYDTSGLTDKDIIRVLEDSTHDNNSTYYRWNAATNQFDFVGEISGGGESGGAKVLTTADYNWPVNNPDGVALWLLDSGMYTVKDYSVKTYLRNNYSLANSTYNNFLVATGKNAYNVDAAHIYAFKHDGTSKENLDYWIIRRDTGETYITGGRILTSRYVVDSLSSTSGTDVLSAGQGRVLNRKFGGMQLVSITQTDYDALATKDPNTLYIITGA